MAASGRYARGSVVSALIMIQFEFSHSLYRKVVLTSWDCGLSKSESDPTASLPMLTLTLTME